MEAVRENLRRRPRPPEEEEQKEQWCWRWRRKKNKKDGRGAAEVEKRGRNGPAKERETAEKAEPGEKRVKKRGGKAVREGGES